MIPAPVLLIAGPLVAAVIVYVIRRITLVASLVSTAASLGLAWLVQAVPETADESLLGGWVAGGPQSILGRPLWLAPTDRSILIALCLAAAVLFLLAARLRPGDVFFPGLLALLGASAAVLVTETFVFAVLLIEATAGMLAILLQGSRFGSTRAAWRFFLLTTLAMPLLLIAGWHIDFQAANPGQTSLLNPAVLLLTVGFTIYLAAVPFHLWVTSVATSALPLTQVASVGLFQLVLFGFVTSTLEQYPWLASSTIPYQWFSFLGTLTVGFGAALGLAAGSFGQMAGATLLADMGALLLLLGLKSRAGLEAAWLLLLLRLASLIVWEAGLSVIRARVGGDRFTQAGGVGGANPDRQARLATAVLLLGAFSLAGLPLTPGFPGRWLAVGLMARESIGRAVLLLLASASGALAALRAAGVMLGPAAVPETDRSSGRWGWLTTVALIVLLLGALAMALFPSPVIAAAARLADHLTFLPR